MRRQRRTCKFIFKLIVENKIHGDASFAHVYYSLTGRPWVSEDGSIAVGWDDEKVETKNKSTLRVM